MHPRQIAIDNIDNYMKSISSYPRVTVEEEITLYNTMHGPDPVKASSARETLIHANLRLVVKIAHDFKRFNLPFSDLVAEGNSGLMTAVDKFNPSKGAKFSCYAAWWIKQAMRKAMAEKPWIVRMPQDQVKRRVRIDHAIQSWIHETGCEPDCSDIADALGMDVGLVREALLYPMDTVSINAPVDTEDERTDFSDLLVQSPQGISDEREAQYKILDSLVASLGDMDRFIIVSTYGIDCVPLPAILIAQETGLSTEQLSSRLETLIGDMRDTICSGQSGASGSSSLPHSV